MIVEMCQIILDTVLWILNFHHRLIMNRNLRLNYDHLFKGLNILPFKLTHCWCITFFLYVTFDL